MKKLELSQMENVVGASCAGDSVSLALCVIGVVASAALGPFGWGAAIALLSSSISFGALIANGDCF